MTINIYGSTGADTITGTEADETISGGPHPIFHQTDTGNDRIDGGGGNDIIYGLAGDDTLQGGVQADGRLLATGDYLYGGDGNDSLYSLAFQGHLFGGAGNDLLNGGGGVTWAHYNDAPGPIRLNLGTTGPQDTQSAGFDTLVAISHAVGSAFDDIMQGSSFVSSSDYVSYTLDGYGGNDLLSGHAGKGQDYLSGGAGDDTIDANGGGTDALYDVIDGGDGNDTAQFWGATGYLSLRLDTGQGVGITQETYGGGVVSFRGIENLEGGNYGDAIVGDEAANRLSGRGGADFLYGLGGDDTLIGGTGNDTMNGGTGPGIDTLSYEGATAAVQVNLGTGYVTGGAGSDLVSGFETVLGSSYNDQLTGSTRSETFDGAGGYDLLSGAAGDDTYILHTLALRPPPVIGKVVIPPQISDYAYDAVSEQAGGGIDTVYVHLINANTVPSYSLTANVENGVIDSPLGFSLYGNDLGNALTGNLGNDTLNGAQGNDTLNGNAGNDAMSGGDGNDTYIVANNGDIVLESTNQGTDTVQSSIAHTLGANVERLFLTGSLTINGNGNELANQIVGNTANNILRGYAGNDSLNGAQGNDTLDGGAGADVIRLMTANAGNDTVLGFSIAEDRFDLSGGQFSNAVISGTDTILTHSGGTVTVKGVTGLSLSQWNAATLRAAVTPEIAAPDARTPAPHVSQDVFVASFLHGREGLFDRHFDSHAFVHADYLA